MVPNIGPIKLNKLIGELNSIEKVCEVLKAPLDLAEQEIDKAQKAGITLLCLGDEDYPEILKNIHDPPAVIYIKGQLLPQDKKAIAIVGTRVPTPYGLRVAGRLASELSQLGITIISGLALGIDAQAHEGALEANGRTLAVLGSAVDEIFPRQNQKLAERIIENGALVSEFVLGTKPDHWTFPQRNRIISGLSLGTIVIEGGYKSGAMITAKLALEQGREVFAVPGNVELEQSKGPHWLIKQGAKLTESIDDVLEELKHVISVRPVSSVNSVEKPDYSNLSDDEKQVIGLLSKEPRHIDELSRLSGLEISKIATPLLSLELKRLIKPLPGKYFILV